MESLFDNNEYRVCKLCSKRKNINLFPESHTKIKGHSHFCLDCCIDFAEKNGIDYDDMSEENLGFVVSRRFNSKTKPNSAFHLKNVCEIEEKIYSKSDVEKIIKSLQNKKFEGTSIKQKRIDARPIYLSFKRERKPFWTFTYKNISKDSFIFLFDKDGGEDSEESMVNLALKLKKILINKDFS